jgi:polyphenol oxidase family protein
MPENVRQSSGVSPARRALLAIALLALFAPLTYAGTAAGSKGGSVRLEADPVTTTIAIPDSLRDRPGSACELHLDGIHLPAHRAAVVHVFGNLPRATAATSTDDPHYLGYFTLVPSGRDQETATDVVLDVTPNLQRLVQEGRELAVTLVPVAADGRKPARGLGLAVDHIYLDQPGQ